MIYDYKRLGSELKKQLESGYDIKRISQWAYMTSLDNKFYLYSDQFLHDLMEYISLMEVDSQFEISKEELMQISNYLLNNDASSVKKMFPNF